MNDLGMDMGGKISTLVDDPRICGVDDVVEGSLGLWGDINVLVKWAEKWQMEFNPGKCEVMHLGRRNEERAYTVCDTQIFKDLRT